MEGWLEAGRDDDASNHRDERAAHPQRLHAAVYEPCQEHRECWCRRADCLRVSSISSQAWTKATRHELGTLAVPSC